MMDMNGSVLRLGLFHHRPYVVVGVAIARRGGRGGGGGGRVVVEVSRMVRMVRMMAYLLLLLDLLHQDGLLLVLAALVLEPDANHPRRQARHLHQLLLHQGVGTGIGRVAGAQRVQLLLVQYRADSRRLAVRPAAAAAARDAARPADAAHSAFAVARPPRPLAALLPRRRRDASVGTIWKFQKKKKRKISKIQNCYSNKS